MAFDPSMQDPAAAPAQAAPEAPAAAPGFTVCLKVGGDGQMSVSVEPDGEDAPAPGADPSADPAEEAAEAQPVGNIGEALKLIREIVQHGGEQVDAAAGQDAMSAGYGQGGM